MSNPDTSKSVELEFSKKYNRDHAQQYASKHSETLSRRLSNWREQRIARSSLKLAGNPKSVLDLPCGAGRFLPLLAEQPNRKIYAADYSEDMLEVVKQACDEALVQHVELFQSSAFDIQLPDNSVDCIFSMRLMHHIGNPENRAQMLKEFYRVSADTVCVSLWVDGNRQAKRRQKLEKKRQAIDPDKYNQNRFVIRGEQIEQEFMDAGFNLLGSFDFLPYISMWRIYVLKK